MTSGVAIQEPSCSGKSSQFRSQRVEFNLAAAAILQGSAKQLEEAQPAFEGQGIPIIVSAELVNDAVDIGERGITDCQDAGLHRLLALAKHQVRDVDTSTPNAFKVGHVGRTDVGLVDVLGCPRDAPVPCQLGLAQPQAIALLAQSTPEALGVDLGAPDAIMSRNQDLLNRFWTS
jgi:hypothetical protein